MKKMLPKSALETHARDMRSEEKPRIVKDVAKKTLHLEGNLAVKFMKMKVALEKKNRRKITDGEFMQRLLEGGGVEVRKMRDSEVGDEVVMEKEVGTFVRESKELLENVKPVGAEETLNVGAAKVRVMRSMENKVTVRVEGLVKEKMMKADSPQNPQQLELCQEDEQFSPRGENVKRLTKAENSLSVNEPDGLSWGREESRHIPLARKHEALSESQGLCAHPNCTKLAEEFHHPERFSQNKTHENIKALCKNHHSLAHLGLIKNETQKPENWFAGHRINLNFTDSLVQKYRVGNLWGLVSD